MSAPTGIGLSGYAVEGLKRYLPVVLVSCLVGVAIGWASKPDVVQTKIEEKVKVVEVVKEVVVIQEKVKLQIEYVKDVQVVDRWHREKTEERKPDGTVTTKEIEDRNIDSHSTEKQNTVEVRVVEVEKQVVVEKEVEKLVKVTTTLKLPDWHLAAMGGLTPQFLPVPTVQSWAVGASVDRRIVGPIFLGIWGMGTTDGRAMGGLRVAGQL